MQKGLISWAMREQPPIDGWQVIVLHSSNGEMGTKYWMGAAKIRHSKGCLRKFRQNYQKIMNKKCTFDSLLQKNEWQYDC